MDTADQQRRLPRRGLLALGAGAAAGLAGGTGTAAAQNGTETTSPGTTTPQTRAVPDFQGYLDNVSNFDGTVADERDTSEVSVAVGAPGNNGNFAFEPAAVHVDAGTTVVWEWTGEGNQHNVVAREGEFDSGDPVAEAGTAFRHTFEADGIYLYLCDPHEVLGMKAAIVVGEDYPTRPVEMTPSGGTGGEDDGGTEPPGETAGNQTAANTLLAMLGLGFLSPVVFALLLRWRRSRGQSS